jgi:flagellar biosynthesis protein FlhA
MARSLDKEMRAKQKAAAAAPGAAGGPGAGPASAADEPISEVLKMDDLKVEIGYGLLPLINSADGSDRVTEQIKALRRQLASEMGFVMPSVRILDNVQLDANAYSIRVKEIEAGMGTIFPGQFMAIDPMGGQVQLPGQHMLEPTFGLPATWIDASLRDEAQLRGYTVVDAATVLSTHLTEVIKAHMPDLLSHVEVQKLLKDLSKEHADLVKEIVPSSITTTGIQRVLQILLAERVSIRDLGTILEGISEMVGGVRNPRDIAEHVRTRLARQICAQYTAPGGYLPIVTLSPQWEQAFIDSIVGQGEERHLAMQPSRLTEFVSTVRDRFEDAARMGEMPVLVTSVQSRPFVRSIIERFRRETPVMSQGEIHSRVRLKTVGSV